MTSKDFPRSTERLTLRTHAESDAAKLQRIYAQPDVARFLLDEPWTDEIAHEKVAARLTQTDLTGDSGAIALVIERDGTVLGDVSLWFTDREQRIAEIGWVLDPAAGGQGFAAEAVAAVLDHAFEHCDVHRVVALMDARNHASAKLAMRVGMRREAHHRHDWWSKGEWTDTLVFGRLAGDAS